MRPLPALIAFLALILGAPVLAADAWPSRPVRMVVPFPPGSSPDLIGRMLGEPLAKALGQPVVIDNRPGAGGNIGTEFVAKAAPDGYTIVLTINGPLVTSPSLYKKLGYDPFRDLAPITLVATSPNVLVVDARLGVGSVKEFIALAKSRAGAMNYGSVGAGSSAHLAMEMLKTAAGLDIVHVPYAGFPAVTTAMLSGQIHAGFMVPAIAMAQVRAGKLKALAVTSTGRSAALSEFPTMIEAGVANFEQISWQAILAPARTPQPVINRLHVELSKIIRSDDVRGKMLAQYFSAAGTAPEALTNLMRTEKARSDRLIRALKLSLD